MDDIRINPYGPDCEIVSLLHRCIIEIDVPKIENRPQEEGVGGDIEALKTEQKQKECRQHGEKRCKRIFFPLFVKSSAFRCSA